MPDHITAHSSHPRFLWSDAWFLTALGTCDAGPVSLRSVIATGDMLQHAIFNREEVNGAIGRLGRAGYVQRHPDGTLEVTEAGRSLVVDSGEGRRVPLSEWQDRVRSLLGALPWTPADDPRRAGEGEAEQVSEAEYDAAVRNYHKGFRD